MKLKKVLLSCAIFVVVSLCSFTVAYADGVTGSVTAAMLDYTHYFNSNTVQDDTYVNLRSYDFPITSQVKLWKITNNSLVKFITVGFDTPVHDGVLYFEGYDQYVHWNGLDSVYANFENGTSKNISSLVTYSVDSDNWITFTVNLSSISSSDYSSRGDISYLTIYFPENQGSIHSEMDCMYFNLFNSSSSLDDLVPILNNIKSNTDNLPQILSVLLNIKADTSDILDTFNEYLDIYNAIPMCCADPDGINGYQIDIVDVPYDVALELVNALSNRYVNTQSNMFINSLGNVREQKLPGFFNIHSLGTDNTEYFPTGPYAGDYICLSYYWNGAEPGERLFHYAYVVYAPNAYVLFFRVTYPDKEQGMQQQQQLDDATGEASSALEAQEELESQFQGSMTSNFNALNVSSFTFDTDAQNGLAMAGDVFSEIWGAFGKWSILYSFPLLLGVVLLLIGKISKTAGRSSSKGKGDDE